MHEFGLMASVLQTAGEQARAAGASQVLAIELVVGQMTQVVDEAMRFAFDAMSPGTICQGAELRMRFVSPRSRCLACGLEFGHDPLDRICPGCGSPATQIVAGRELLIDKIEVELPDEAQAP